jgi:nitroreductase
MLLWTISINERLPSKAAVKEEKPMDVMEAIRERRSVRAYQDKAVPEERLRAILEAARLAPSASNRQQWRFIVVQDLKRRISLMKAAGNQGFVGEAPIIIAAVALAPDYIMHCDVPSYPVDIAIAVDHMSLKAVEEGLGSCWIGHFEQERVKEILQIPKEYKVVALLTLGYAKDKPRPKNRRPLEEIVSFEVF